MAARGRKQGTPKTGGRKKGSVNKATAARQAEIAASGLAPLDYLVEVMRDATETPERRLEAAKAAAPYVHPRLSAVEGSHSLSIKRHEDWLDELENASSTDSDDGVHT